MKQYFANVSAGRGTPATSGGDDKQVDGVPKMAPVVAAYASKGLGPTLSAVRKPAAFFAPFYMYAKNDHFTKTGSGQSLKTKEAYFRIAG
jgi:hypothetical protein